MPVLTSATISLILLALFVAGCLMALYGVVVSIALLDKPRNWFCHLRGLSLIGLFVMSAVGLCGVLFAGVRPDVASSIYTGLTGMLIALYGRQLRVNSVRLRGLKGRASLHGDSK